MMKTRTLILYGNAKAREIARELLENMTETKGDTARNGSEIRLSPNEHINETSLIPLLQQSGIYGFRLVKSR